MGRRSVVKVDYSKFDAETANSDEDDDFQDGTPPKKGKTKKSHNNQLQVKKPEITITKESKRKTRTSNADLLYQQDIITAIKVSETKNVIVKVNKSVTKNAKTKKHSLISDGAVCDKHGDFPSSCIYGKKYQDEEDSHIPDTLPVADNLNKLNQDHVEIKEENDEDEKDGILTTSGTLKVSHLKENIESEEEIDTMLSTKKYSNRKSKQVEGKEKKVGGSKTTQSKSNETYKEKILIPGRLRIGLSRNLRVTKPLHPGVSPKV